MSTELKRTRVDLAALGALAGSIGRLGRANIVSGSAPRRLERANIASGSAFRRSNELLERSKDDLGSIFVDLSSILDPQRVDSGGFSTPFRCFRTRAGELARRRGDLWKTCQNHTKTLGFYMFSTCQRLRARCEHRPKIVPNALLDRVAQRIIFERRFFRAPKPQNGALRTLRGVSGRS